MTSRPTSASKAWRVTINGVSLDSTTDVSGDDSGTQVESDLHPECDADVSVVSFSVEWLKILAATS